MTAPVSSVAALVPPDTVLPFTPGVVSVTSNSRFLGTSTLMTCMISKSGTCRVHMHRCGMRLTIPVRPAVTGYEEGEQ